MQDFKEMLGLNFNEQHLGGMLYDMYYDEKYYVLTREDIIIEDCTSTVKQFHTYTLSQCKKFIYSHDEGILKIEALNSIEPSGINEIMSIETGLERFSCHTMVDNLIYCVIGTKLYIFDIQIRKKNIINLPYIVDFIYVYDGNIYCSSGKRILMLCSNGENYIFSAKWKVRINNYQDHILYASDAEFIYMIDTINKISIKIIKPPYTSAFIGTKYGIISGHVNLTLPSGNIINAGDEGFMYFDRTLNLSNDGSKLICLGSGVSGTMTIMIIDLSVQPETIIKSKDYPLAAVGQVGFLLTHSSDKTEPIRLKEKDFDSLMIELEPFKEVDLF
jgi:hypothetical protein